MVMESRSSESLMILVQTIEYIVKELGRGESLFFCDKKKLLYILVAG